MGWDMVVKKTESVIYDVIGQYDLNMATKPKLSAPFGLVSQE
jgi:hypothetical protein